MGNIETKKTTFSSRSTAFEVIEGHDLTGKEAIVTGAAGGIGVETARALASAGARVIIAARDLRKAALIAADIKKTTNNANVEVEYLELGSLYSVDKFVEKFLAKKRPLHILINNAGVMNTPHGFTEDGFETQFGVNHVGHFALTVGLLSALKAANGARVVSVTSFAHAWGKIDFEDVNFLKGRKYEGFKSYAQSKTANILFAVELTNRYQADGVYANAVMPGFIMTGLQRHTSAEQMIERKLFYESGKPIHVFKTVEQGAATSVWAAVAPELEARGGLYLNDCNVSSETTLETIMQAEATGYKDGVPTGFFPYAIDPAAARRLWDLTVKMITDAKKKEKNISFI